MATENSSATSTTSDRPIQAAVLAVVLDEHPDQFTTDELVRTISPGRPDFATDDATRRAVQTLIGCGLLRLTGEVLTPTRAALCSHRLAAYQ